MRGRAGRKGKDEVGETYLCCHEGDVVEAAQLIQAELPVVTSCLEPEKRGIKRQAQLTVIERKILTCNRALLEVITVRLATHPIAIQEYVRRTLLFHTLEAQNLDLMVEKAIQQLIADGFIEVDNSGSYQATQLSRAVVSSYMTPEDGLIIYGELRRALQAFVMDGELHVFYLFTPIQLNGMTEIDWQIFRREMENLDDSGMRVLRLIGVNPGLVNKM